MYKKLAEQFEHVHNVQDALYYYHKCLDVAESSEDQEEEGIISHKIGNLLFNKFDDYAKTIIYQKKYLESAQLHNTNNAKEKQMQAHAALAKTYMKLEENEEAQNHLIYYYNLARELSKKNAMSDATLYLAELNRMKNNTSKSLEYY